MKAFLLAAAASLASATVIPREVKVDYTGYKVFRVDASENDAAVARQIEQFHVSRKSSPAAIDVVVAPEKVATFEALSLNSTLLDADLGAAIAAEGQSSVYAAPDDSWFDSYHPFADHQQFVRDLQTALPSNSEVVSAGTSYQGRTILGLHIWGSGGKNSKPNVLIHGNVHAREWIAGMTTEYFLYQLVTGYPTSTTVKSYVDNFDIWIFPIVNPDGFVYTQTTNRLWRKNRQPVSGNTCIGTDPNRNWPYQWTVPGGSSTDPCSETYRGPSQSSTPEITALVNQVKTLTAGKGIRMYIDFHSYGQYILTPYGYSCSAVAANSATQNSLAAGAATAIRAVSGTRYTTGPSCSTLYATSGSSTDYVGDVAKATYTFTYELRDTGTNGFTLPANQIRPTAVETWAGLQYMLARI